MKKEDCIFCKLANGQIPANTIYEDERYRVILDMGPASRGHALIIPKEHSDNLYDLPDDSAAGIMILARKMAVQMTQKLHCAGFNVVQNNGEIAGQTVFHFHMHLIPRYADDGQRIGWIPGSPEPGELDEVRRQIVE